MAFPPKKPSFGAKKPGFGNKPGLKKKPAGPKGDPKLIAALAGLKSGVPNPVTPGM